MSTATQMPKSIMKLKINGVTVSLVRFTKITFNNDLNKSNSNLVCKV